MTKIRIFVDATLSTGESVSLNKDQSHYLHSVMRLKSGDTITIFNEVYGEFTTIIDQSTKSAVALQIGNQLKSPKPEQKLTLLFAPLKVFNASLIVQKATELGASNIQPILTKRSVVDKVNTDKLILAAIEAAEQCERLSIPIINAIQPLEKALSKHTFTGKLYWCDESGSGNNFATSIIPSITDNAILIGPEGGFDYDEKMYLSSQDFIIPVSLGDRILRAETAIISAMAVYNLCKGNG
jgi:16S rRNA (uracil1498-N3)-methyltransferase